MIPKRIIAAAAVAAASLVSAGITQPASAAADGPKTTFGAPHAGRAHSGRPGGAATGSIWKVEATVNPQGMAPNPTNSTLTSVSATGPGEAWAVGTFMDQKALDHPLAEHRSGSTWTRVPVPQPAGQQALLNAVDDLSPGNAWAVGTSFSGGVAATPDGPTLIEHWNGTSWSIVPSPNPATGIPGRSRTCPTTRSTRSPPPGPATCSPSAPGRPRARPSSAPWPSPPRKDELSPVNPAGPRPGRVSPTAAHEAGHARFAVLTSGPEP